MKKLIFAALILAAFTMNAQVGVNTENPQTNFHVAGVNEVAGTPGAIAVGDGVLVSRTNTDLSGGAVTTGCSAAATGALVFSTTGTLGFYYCDGTVWTAVGGGAAPSTPTVRTTNVSTLTNADLNNIVVAQTGATTFDVGGLTPSEGDTITIQDATGTGVPSLTSTGDPIVGQVTLLAPGGGLTCIYDADTSTWYMTSSF